MFHKPVCCVQERKSDAGQEESVFIYACSLSGPFEFGLWTINERCSYHESMPPVNLVPMLESYVAFTAGGEDETALTSGQKHLLIIRSEGAFLVGNVDAK